MHMINLNVKSSEQTHMNKHPPRDSGLSYQGNEFIIQTNMILILYLYCTVHTGICTVGLQYIPGCTPIMHDRMTGRH